MPEFDSFGTRLAGRLIRRVRVRTTHQALAMDALVKLRTPQADLWRRMMLRYAHAFAEGAVAPDTDFRDFKNHVLFPEDGWWGGAATKAQAWYINLTNALTQHEWRNAAFCAGVLCHYLTDPLHPFHTGQSVAENDVHYAADAAVWLNYPALAALGAAEFPGAVVRLDEGSDFLAYALAAGSEAAHGSFDALLSHFDLERARKQPAAGLDRAGRYLMADMIAHATALFAATLDRAITEAGVVPPRVTLTFVGLRSGLAAPFAALAKRSHARKMRRLIRRMAEEQALHGQVLKYLPDEQRVKRDAYAKDVSARQATTAATAALTAEAARVRITNVLPFEPKLAVDTRADEPMRAEIHDLRRPRMVVEPARPAPRSIDPGPSRHRENTTRGDGRRDAGVTLSTYDTKLAAGPAGAGAASASRAAASPALGAGHAAAAMLATASASGLSNFRDRRSMPVPDPADVGLRHFERFAAASKSEQAQMIKSIPGLTAPQAQLLAGAGYATIDAIADASIEKFCADILSFALTKTGQRSLRDAPPPDIETVQKWVDLARAARAA